MGGIELNWLDNLREDEMKRIFAETIYERGKEYHLEGKVHDLSFRNGTLSGKVKGSQGYSYEVMLTKRGKELTGYCSCPYPDNCKHMVAVLLEALNNVPSTSDVRAYFSADITHNKMVEYLKTLPEKELRSLVLDLMARHPEEEERMELFLMLPEDTEGFMKRARAIVNETFGRRSFIDYYEVGDYTSRLIELSKMGKRLLSMGYPALAALFYEYMIKKGEKRLQSLDDADGFYSSFIASLYPEWGEALAKVEDLDFRKLAKKLIEKMDNDLIEPGDIVRDFGEALGEDGIDYLRTTLERVLDKERDNKEKFLKTTLMSIRFESAREILKAIALKRGEIDRYIELCMYEPNIRQYLDAIRLLKQAGQFERALKTAEKGNEQYANNYDLRFSKAELLFALNREEAKPFALENFRVYPELETFEFYLKMVAPQEREAEIEKQLDWLAMNAPANLAVPLLAHYGKLELLKWLYENKKRELEGYQYALEHTANGLAEKYPEMAAKIYFELANFQLQKARTKLYPTAVKYLKNAKELLIKIGKSDKWVELEKETVSKHGRKTSFMEKFKQIMNYD